jgi:hypothetical protein
VKVLRRIKVNICCVQESKWKGGKIKNIRRAIK